jgi:hypothetical protein
MTDPRDLSPDQRELLDACEQVALLPPDAPLEALEKVEEAFDAALTLMEADHGGRLMDKDIIGYRDRFLADGQQVAAEGVQRMLERLAGEIAHGSASN